MTVEGLLYLPPEQDKDDLMKKKKEQPYSLQAKFLWYLETEPMAHGYSSESTQRELSNEYQHDRVKII